MGYLRIDGEVKHTPRDTYVRWKSLSNIIWIDFFSFRPSKVFLISCDDEVFFLDGLFGSSLRLRKEILSLRTFF